MINHLLPLLSALYFSGAQTSGTIIPRVPCRILSKFESKKRFR